MRSVSIGVAINLGLLALLIGLFTSNWLSAAGYFTGLVATLIGYVSYSRTPGTAPLDRQAMIVDAAVMRHQYGRVFAPLVNLIWRSIHLLNWPIKYVRGLYLLLARRSQVSDLRTIALGDPLVPAWIGPSGFTAAVLLLVAGQEDTLAGGAIAAALCLSTGLVLLNSVFMVSLKEEVLGRGGNPRLSLLLMLIFNLVAAAMSRRFLAHWFGGDNDSLLQSAYKLFSFRDVTTIADGYGLSLEAIASDPGALANLTNVPAHLYAQVGLGILFYFGIFSVGKQFLFAKREPRHYVPLGKAEAALGRYDQAEALLAKATGEKEALNMLAAVRLIRRKYAELGRAARRLFGIADIPYSAEEEAVQVIWATATQMSLTAEDLAAYFNARADDFTEPAFTSLFAMLAEPALADPANALDAYRAVPHLAAEPTFRAYLLERQGDVANARAILDSVGAPSPCGRIARLFVGLSSLRHDPPGAPFDPHIVAAINADLAFLEADQSWLDLHWRQRFAVDAMRSLRALYWRRFGRLHPAIEALREAGLARLADSELVAEYLPVMIDAGERSFMDMVAKMAPAPQGAAA